MLMAVPAMAQTVTLKTSPYSYSTGGEFTWAPEAFPAGILNNYAATTKNISQTGTFQSFCIETNEFIGYNTPYNVAFSNAAMDGGSGGATNKVDPISKGTAYLYSQFAAGTLQYYNYGTNRLSSAGALQNAIWMLEGEGGLQFDTNNTFLALLLSMGTDWTQDKLIADANGSYGVQVMNLTDAAGKHQDQLVMVSGTVNSALVGNLSCWRWCSGQEIQHPGVNKTLCV